MAARNEIYMGIDLSNPVRMVLVSGKPPCILATGIAETEFDPDDKASLIKLAGELKEFSRKYSRKPLCVVGLPPGDSILFSTALPPLDDKEVIEAIKHELTRMLPDKAAEMRATYQVWPDGLPSLPTARPSLEGRTYVVAAAESRSVAAIKTLIKTAGLALLAVEVPACAACRASWLAKNLNWGASIFGETKDTSTLRTTEQGSVSRPFGDLSLQISIVVSQDVRMYLGFGPYPWIMREIPLAGEEVHETASVLAGEIVRSVRFVRSGPGPTSAGVVTLIGKNPEVDMLAEVLRDRIGFVVDVWALPGVACPPDYGIAAGLAFRKGGCHGFGTGR
ncbi:MAG: hypothetical protein IMF26_09015 [Candidatus Fermentithermobacillus carboniphilus]|uniref:SHS2 domain-containing protein n=1 Tax=Candidatus Fermentithermobacillus carboniphilus TaxID=3085328 RepID=A0AAT9LAS7_9FIRM|nr:MAG: hypothetical protein IMF26_09015 [Candidatus Fermentithermobacillus carboniphilus]